MLEFCVCLDCVSLYLRLLDDMSTFTAHDSINVNVQCNKGDGVVGGRGGQKERKS